MHMLKFVLFIDTSQRQEKRQTERHRETETERHTHTQRERERERDRAERQRQRELDRCCLAMPMSVHSFSIIFAMSVSLLNVSPCG